MVAIHEEEVQSERSIDTNIRMYMNKTNRTYQSRAQRWILENG